MLAFFLFVAIAGVSLLVRGFAYAVITRNDRPADLPEHRTGREVAEVALTARQVSGVRVVAGDVDCYLPAEREIRLAEGRLDRASTSAAAIAALEAMHAAQDASGSRWLRASTVLTVVALAAGPVAFVLLATAWMFDLAWLRLVGLAFAAPVVLAGLAATVVEAGAVRGARRALQDRAIARTVNTRGARCVLVGGGATYVTEAVYDPGYFLRSRQRRADPPEPAPAPGPR